MNNYKLLTVTGAAFIAGCSSVLAQKQKPERPNFLFVLVDDQPYDALGFYDRYPFLETPNMDKLAEEGVNFTNYFVTQSISSPSRASFLTGMYPHKHGVNQNNRKVDPNWEKYEPYTKLLQEVGYETSLIGKIHMAHFHGHEHIRPGFDYWYSFIGQGDYFDPMVNDNGKEYREEGYMTDILTEKTVEWLTRERDTSKPFSLCLWHKSIHEPHKPAPRNEDLYRGEKLPPPPYNTHKETFEGKPKWQIKKKFEFDWKNHLPLPDKLPAQEWPIKKEKFMNMLRCLKSVDESLGTVIQTLKETGELDNTVVIFSSDNGYFMGEHTYHDKRIAYEASIRIPMIIRYPEKINPGSTIDEICVNIDLAPTLLEMAGAEIPPHIQGESMTPLFSDGDYKWRDAYMFEYYVDDAYPYAGPDMLAIRSHKYKLVDNFLEDDIDELYHLEDDPGEMNNLINDPDYDTVEQRLRLELVSLKEFYEYNPDRDWWLNKVLDKRK